MKLSTKLWIVGFLLLLISACNGVGWVYNTSTTMYNTNASIVVQYKQASRAQASAYDANYLIFKQKSAIANLNKETFTEVTNIIMANGRDGENVSWKWVQRQYPDINYEVFARFYEDLSNFTAGQYNALFAYEKQKQDLASQQNLLLRTYPNNIVNWWLKLPEVEYKPGYSNDPNRGDILINQEE